MKMKNNIIFYAVLFCSILMTSCIKEKLEVTYNRQEDQINSYIESALKKDESYTTVRNGGSNRLILKQGEGEELTADGSITFYYAGYIFKGNITSSGLFATNREESANDANWEVTDPTFEPLTLNLKDSNLLTGLKDGLIGVKGGEECEIIFSGKYGFGNDSFGIIPANSALLFKIWVISISNE